MAWTATVLLLVTLAAMQACSEDATSPLRFPRETRPLANIVLPTDTTGTVVFSTTLPLTDTSPYLIGFPLDTFSQPRLVQLTLSGMIDAHNIPGEYADRVFGPDGWWDQPFSVSLIDIYVFFNNVNWLGPAPGDHTGDSTRSRIWVANGPGHLNRGPGFTCDIVMPHDCWSYSYVSGHAQNITVKVLDVPTGMDVETVPGVTLTSHVPAGTYTFRWAMPTWELNAGAPYKIQAWHWYPVNGPDSILSSDTLTRFKTRMVSQSGTMRVTALVNGVVRTDSASIVIRCHMGDTVLDNQVIADTMEKAWDLTKADSAPDQRREQPFTYWTDSANATHIQTNFNDPNSTPCTSAANWGPQAKTGVIVHTHPFTWPAIMPVTCPKGWAGTQAAMCSGDDDRNNLPINAFGVVIQRDYVCEYKTHKRLKNFHRTGPGCQYP